jgi:hypothetical protein
MPVQMAPKDQGRRLHEGRKLLELFTFAGAPSTPSRRAGAHLEEGKEPGSPRSGSLLFSSARRFPNVGVYSGRRPSERSAP